MLARSQFNAACKALVAKHPSSDDPPQVASIFGGWSWREHSTYSGLGYLTRSSVHHRTSVTGSVLDSLPSAHDVLEEEDDAALNVGSSEYEVLNCCQYIVFSSTFQVPAFYFSIHDSNGSPLALSEIVKTSLFCAFAFEGADATTFAVSLPTSGFPLLSQGEHPTLGTPCWFLHPCETASAVGEIISGVQEADWTEEQRLVRWMEVWFMLVGSVVDLCM